MPCSTRLPPDRQSHRRLTRRLIEAFPADQLNTFSLGDMRPIGAQVLALLAMPVPTMVGITSGKWEIAFDSGTYEKAELLARWDARTNEIDLIDNEVHHRGQGYVYLRALGIEPPAFHVRD